MPKKKQPAPPSDPSLSLEDMGMPTGIETFPSPVLVTTRDWFRGPSGEQYQCLWGAARFVAGEDLDPKLPDPQKLFLAIGSGDLEVLLDWNQVAAVLTCPEPPHRGSIYMTQLFESLEL